MGVCDASDRYALRRKPLLMTTHHLPKVAGISPPLSASEHTVPSSASGSSAQNTGDGQRQETENPPSDGTCHADCAHGGTAEDHPHDMCEGAPTPVEQLAAAQDRLAGWISDLTTLHELTELLTRATTLEDALHETLRGGATLVGARRGLIVLEPVDGLGPDQTLGLGLGRADIGQIETVTDSTAFYGRLLDGLPEPGQPDEISHPDIAEEDGLDPRHREVAARLGYAASYAVPLVATNPTPGRSDQTDSDPSSPLHDSESTASGDDVTNPPAERDEPAQKSPEPRNESPGPGSDAADPAPEAAGPGAASAKEATPGDATPAASPPARSLGQSPRTTHRVPVQDEAGGRLGAVVWLYDEPAEPSERQRHLLNLYLQCAAEHLARRLSLFRAETSLTAVQEELLPSRLPRVPGVQLAVRQFTGPRGGGDWYDVLPLPEAALGLAVGGVTGSGPSAIAAMGRLRASLRAYAVMEGEDPVAVLSDLELLMRLTEPARSATALFGYTEPAARRIVLAGAGHCPPLIVGPSRCEFVETTLSAPLGMLACWEAPSVEVTLAAGETLLLYTDGLLHRTGEPVDRAFARLQTAALTAAPAVRDDPDALVDHVLRKVLGRRRCEQSHQEDVVLLAARF